MIPEKLKHAIEETKQELQNNHDGELILPFRKNIWANMGEYRSELGQKRRTKLDILCVEYAMPVWDYVKPPEKKPTELIRRIYEYYDGRIDWDKLKGLRNDYWTYMDNISLKLEYQLAALVGYAATKAVSTAKFDLKFGECDQNPNSLDNDSDPYGWNCSYNISGAVAGFKWIEGANIERRRTFWNWYLDKAVPEAYNAYPER